MLSTFICQAKSLGSEAEIDALLESVMSEVGKGKVMEAVKELKPYGIAPDSVFESNTLALSDILPSIEKKFGSTIGYDRISAKKSGSSLIEYVYIQKIEKSVLIWRFVFYRPAQEWILFSWAVNDKTDDLF